MSVARRSLNLDQMAKPPGAQTAYVKVVLPLPEAYEVAGCAWYPFALCERLQGADGPTSFYWNLARTRLTLLYRVEVAPKVAEGKELTWLRETLAKGKHDGQ